MAACWGCSAQASTTCVGCQAPICSSCCFNQSCFACSQCWSPDNPQCDPHEDRPVQNQTWKPMKAGTAKILDAGVRQAQAQIKHRLNAHAVKQCLLVSQASLSLRQASDQARGSRRTSFHEYCCGDQSKLGKEASKRGHKVNRWGTVQL